MGKLVQGWSSEEFQAPGAIFDTTLPVEVKISYLFLIKEMKDGKPNPSITDIMMPAA
ncbi:hypothetical protein C8P63_12235 [Melghirimyces profundicolus]|uniref:Uncharacterized protein n=1 Tax=Melghirimyces profundicolus TaxID=1242148 RepID=A0A2T6BG81_9BACL|nr:hypothetical protein [Melghirimyces profundicolus]PTX55075.1 hypothetical protein C8P63_12235 [Melghirimyces profundicolus]